MKNKNIIYISLFLFLLLLTGCTKKHTHNYSLEWEWGKDVVAIFMCECGESTQKLLADVSEEVIAEADCINDGEINVTAKVMFNNVLYEKTKIVTIPKKGHDISTVIEPGFVSEGYTADICSRCNYIFNKYAYTKPILKLEYISDGYYVVTGVNDYNVSEIVIPKVYNGSSVQKIGDEAFAYCTNLTNITIPDSVTNIGSSAFNNCTNLTSIDVSKNNNYYKSIDGNLYSKDGAKLIQYAIGKKQNEFVIPDSVTNIGPYAFNNCTNLTNVIIPDSVTNIEHSAFNNCTNLTIYCESTSKPIGWDYYWNGSNCPVVWGYK